MQSPGAYHIQAAILRGGTQGQAHDCPQCAKHDSESSLDFDCTYSRSFEDGERRSFSLLHLGLIFMYFPRTGLDDTTRIAPLSLTINRRKTELGYVPELLVPQAIKHTDGENETWAA